MNRALRIAVLALLAVLLLAVGAVAVAVAPRQASTQLHLAKPRVEVAPPKRTGATTARFRFRLGTRWTPAYRKAFRVGQLRWECRLDSRRPVRCGRAMRNRTKVADLAPGAHRYCIRVVRYRTGRSRTATRRGPASCVRWHVERITLGGNAEGHLQPGGTPAPIDLRFGNPTGQRLLVQEATVRVRSTSAVGCRIEDFATFPLTTPIELPARASHTLSQLGLPRSSWPSVRMLETGRNQDACRRAVLHLDYTTTARSLP